MFRPLCPLCPLCPFPQAPVSPNNSLVFLTTLPYTESVCANQGLSMKKMMIATACAAVALTVSAQHNLLLNGGFEGTLDGWIPRSTPATVVETRDAPQGRFVLRVAGDGFVHSQPMLMEPGKTYTVAGWARAVTPEGAGKTLSMTIHPTPRQAGHLPFAIGRGGDLNRTWQDPLLATD